MSVPAYALEQHFPQIDNWYNDYINDTFLNTYVVNSLNTSAKLISDAYDTNNVLVASFAVDINQTLYDSVVYYDRYDSLELARNAISNLPVGECSGIIQRGLKKNDIKIVQMS